MAINTNRLAELLGYYGDAVAAEAGALQNLTMARDNQRLWREQIEQLVGKNLADQLLKGEKVSG